MSKHIEAEGGELLIRSSNGYMAIIPKNMAEFVKEHIKSGNHAVVDNYVKGLKEMKDGSKAQDGGTIKPPTKGIAPAESTGNNFGMVAAQNFRMAQQNAEKERLYRKALEDKTGAAEEYFTKRYNTSPHRYKYDTDPQYRKEVDVRSAETSKKFGSIDLPATDVRSRNYAGNPNLAFMTHKGMSNEGRKALEESNLMAIGSVLPIPGLQTVGKVPSVFSPLIKAGSKVASLVKAEPFVVEIKGLEGQISKLKAEEKANENLQKSLWADVKSGNLSKQDYAKKMSELPSEDVISRRGALEKELRQTIVKKDIHNLPQEDILKSESQLGKDISNGGTNTVGVYELGENHVARLSSHGYDDASRLLKYKAAIKSPRIARTLQVKNIDGKVYQVQEKVGGTPITKLTETEIKQIPKEHINNFWKDKAELDKLGLNIDISGGKSNIFYDPNKGFQIIDLGIGKPSASDAIIQQYPFLQKAGAGLQELGGKVLQGRKVGTTLVSPQSQDVMKLAKPSPSAPESVALADFKARIQTPEGRRRLEKLGILGDKQLQDLRMVNTSAEQGAYYPDINYATVNPADKMPANIARHEIEHAVQDAYQSGREQVYGTEFDPFPYMKSHRVTPGQTDIDRSMAMLETWDEPLKNKREWDDFSKSYSYESAPKPDKDKMALNYFVWGSNGREKSAFLGEVQQYMLDKKLINHPYQKITMDDVKNAYKTASANNDELRLFNISKPNAYNFALIRDNLNKMLTLTGAAGAGATTIKRSNEKR
jgi:hypothetical protein